MSFFFWLLTSLYYTKIIDGEQFLCSLQCKNLQFKSPLLLQPMQEGNIFTVCTSTASHIKCRIQLTRVMSHPWELEGLLSCRTHTPSPRSGGCWGCPVSLSIMIWLPRDGSLAKPAGQGLQRIPDRSKIWDTQTGSMALILFSVT